jgi:hypothetical protein
MIPDESDRMTLETLLERTIRNEDEWEKGHRRIRESLAIMGDRLDELDACQATMRLEAQRMQSQIAQPPDLTRSVLPTRLWLTVLGSTLVLAVSIFAAAYSVKSDVRDLSTRQASESRLNDERFTNQQRMIEDVKRDSAVQRMQLESLTKLLISRWRQ